MSNCVDENDKTLSELLEKMGLPEPVIPKDFLNLHLNDVKVCLKEDTNQQIITAKISQYNNCDFLLFSDPASTYAFTIKLNQSFTLSDMEIFGKKFSELSFISLKIQELLYFNEPNKVTDVQDINKVISEVIEDTNLRFPIIEVAFGLRLTGSLNIAEVVNPVSLFMGFKEDYDFENLITGEIDIRRELWFPAQYTFGILTFRRVGLKFTGDKLNILLDALLLVSGLQFELDGLGLETRLERWDPVYQLKGLILKYDAPPLIISGGLLNTDNENQTDYSGVAVIEIAEERSFGAIASYSDRSGKPSLFTFLRTSQPIGGPPYLYVNGLAFGFGVNRRFQEPKPEDVLNVPLIKNMDGQQDMQELKKMLKELESGWIKEEIGSNWLAVGVNFSTFEFIDSNALLIGQFGKDFELILLALSTLAIPKENPAIFVQIQMKGVWKPKDGFIGVTAMITPDSYLLHKDCRLTGDYASWFWYGKKKPHSGDFVITMGGYHPQFNVPSHYPSLSRLGLNWSIDGVTIQGSAYFALTPSCIMAGGDLELVYGGGDLKVWTSAHAHFLAEWKPFYFEALLGVSFGATYRLKKKYYSITLNFEIGADLELWGPSTGGKVHLGNKYFSLTIKFGSDKEEGNHTIETDEFLLLLPGGKDFVNVHAKTGLIEVVQEANNTWIVNPNEFSFVIETGFPFLEFYQALDNPTREPLSIRPLSIRPLNIDAVKSSKLMINIEGPNVQWNYEEQETKVATALWGSLNEKGRGAETVPHFTEILINPEQANDSTVGIIDLHETYGVDEVSNGTLNTAENMHTIGNPKIYDNSREIIKATLNTENIKIKRTNIISALRFAGLYNVELSDGYYDDSLASLASNAGDLFTEPPMNLKV
ncbi:DUF6603 domain-containing protein [Bacillus thuringiensis]|uniref:DUF6603 domain-containing protein n=1 Tax=Bacillus thuringiensis TaxID=1428 RepID=UPI000BEC4B89|nr:DUF6603 domain-containing protein [Bacillus thuringiensis]MED2871337.1 hypothetical protein [Bacillus thuringiensis]PDY60334.1 hypothetical protein COM87_07615 [Bacillus thuringiensis]PFV76926.1 hypothetical protein COL02_17605 [Bacillus thuringiensis]